MSIIRVVKTANYSIIANVCFRDPKLSARAKGIYGFVMTLPDDWEVHFKNVQEHFREGRDALLKAWGELQRAGYVVKTHTGLRNTNGKFEKAQWVFYEMPRNTPDSPRTEKPYPEKPRTENPELLITNTNKNTPLPPEGEKREGFFKAQRKPVPRISNPQYVLKQVRWLARKWNNRADKFDNYYRHVKVVESSANIAAVKKLLKEAKLLKVDWKIFVNTVFSNIEATMRKYHKCSNTASTYFTFAFILRPKEFTLLYENTRNWVKDDIMRNNQPQTVEDTSVSQAVNDNDPRNPYAKKGIAK